MERSRPRPRVPRATEGAVDDSTHVNRAPKMGTVVNGTYLMNARPPTHTRPQARVRMGAWSVDTGRSQSGVQSDVSRDGGERR